MTPTHPSAPDSSPSDAAAARPDNPAAVRPPVFRVENMFVKNISLEIPDRVDFPTFRAEPAIRMEMRNRARAYPRPNCHEVVLEVTARVNDGDDTQVLVEVAQSGVFFIQGETPRQREVMLNVHAPEILYPYVAQLLADLAARAGAPRFFPPPFNFRALYEQKRRAVDGHEKSPHTPTPSPSAPTPPVAAS